MPRFGSSTGARRTVVPPGTTSFGSIVAVISTSCVDVSAVTRQDPHGATSHRTSAGSDPAGTKG